jgi:hypothetical protein
MSGEYTNTCKFEVACHHPLGTIGLAAIAFLRLAGAS